MGGSEDFSMASHLLRNSTAVEGKCPQGCKTLGLWLVLVGIVIFLIFMLRIPTILITVRCVGVG